jgi:hypothetical protein
MAMMQAATIAVVRAIVGVPGIAVIVGGFGGWGQVLGAASSCGAQLVRVPCAFRLLNGGIEGEHGLSSAGSEDNVERNGSDRANSTLTALSAVNVELARKRALRSTFASPNAGKNVTRTGPNRADVTFPPLSGANVTSGRNGPPM